MIMVMFCKKPMIKKIGEVVLGFGVLFMGLSGMSGSMSSLHDSPLIVDALGSLSNPLLAVLMGFIVTAVVQSSSVTVSIVLLMAQQGLLELGICFYIILGCNIGACTSALLAGLSGKKDAKRASLIHFLFNVFGTVLMVIVLIKIIFKLGTSQDSGFMRILFCSATSESYHKNTGNFHCFQ